MVTYDSEIAKKYASHRPGLHLLDCIPAALPLYWVDATALILDEKEIPPIDEYVLRLINQGTVDLKEISTFLGLSESIVKESLNRLYKDDLLDLPVVGNQRILTLTMKGEVVLTKLVSVTPTKRDIWFAFDRIQWKPVALPSGYLLGRKDVDNDGLLRIRPKLSRKPSLEEIEPDQVESAIEVSMRSVLTKPNILVLKEIGKAFQKFLPCHLLIYGSDDGNQQGIEIVVDGRLEEDISKSLDELGGLKHLKFDFDTSAENDSEEMEIFDEIVPQVSEPILSIEEVRRLRTKQTEIDVSDDASFILDTIEIDTDPEEIVLAKNRAIETFEHPEFFEKALNESKDRLLIMSAFIGPSVVNKNFAKKLRSAANRGVEIFIGYGMKQNSNYPKGHDEGCVRVLKNLSEGNANITVVDLKSSHAKVLIWDHNCITTSFNFLSFKGDKNRTYRLEVGTLVQGDTDFTNQLWQQMHSYIMERIEN